MENSPSKSPAGLSATVVETLRDRIIKWAYPPGHRITEEELCREFGVSRSPVREALRVLSENGFIEKLARRGHVVKQLDVREIKELYEFRDVLETYIVRRLAKSGISEEVLQRLTNDWTYLEVEEPKRGEQLAIMDRDFHEALAEQYGNQAMQNHLHTLNERLFIFRMIDFSQEDRMEPTKLQHLRMLEAIAERNVESAELAMRDNIMSGRENVESTVKDALARSYFNKR